MALCTNWLAHASYSIVGRLIKFVEGCFRAFQAANFCWIAPDRVTDFATQIDRNGLLRNAEQSPDDPIHRSAS